MRAPLERDLRLDFFRGLALWLIFVDHIPSNVVSWITIRNFGFSDATEMFIFISGYTASLVYGRKMQEQGIVKASARILRRSWQIYVAHVFLFVIYVAEIAYASSTFDVPKFANDANVLIFFQHPDIAIVQALLLRFKPVNLDVLPVYIVLLIAFPPILWLLRRAPGVTLAGSLTLYGCVWLFDWNLPAYPDGVWYFNPFAWQALFVFGAWCAAGGAERLRGIARSRLTAIGATIYLVLAFAIAMTWHSRFFAALEPSWLAQAIIEHPIDKTDLHPLRFMHFLALAAVVLRFVPRKWTAWQFPVFRSAVLCGQHSLEIFCAGVFLAFAAHFVLVELWPGIVAEIVVSASGIVLMVGLARLIPWYQGMDALGREPLLKAVPMRGVQARSSARGAVPRLVGVRTEPRKVGM
jgi:hypothetical protein